MSNQFFDLAASLQGVRVLLVGDLIVDHFVYGLVDRISPEYPGTICRWQKESYHPGGAGAVALSLRSLGADVVLISPVNEHIQAYSAVISQLENAKVNVVQCDSPIAGCSIKTRYMLQRGDEPARQCFRIDKEDSGSSESKLHVLLVIPHVFEKFRPEIVMVSDYGKFCCDEDVCKRLLDCAKETGIRCIADPARGVDPERYRGYYALKPNEDYSDTFPEVHDYEDRWGDKITFETRGSDTAILNVSGKITELPAYETPCVDVCGAGDATFAAFGAALARGKTPLESAQFAMRVAAIKVATPGAILPPRLELLRCLYQTPASKIHSAQELLLEVSRLRKLKRKIVFTNGCFDVLHAGHVQALSEARQQGDCLIVAVNSDDSVRKAKGDTRPVNPLSARMEVLQSLSCVDYVVAFDEDTPGWLISAIRPEVLAKGQDYHDKPVAGAESADRVHYTRLIDDVSTSKILKALGVE